MGDHKSDARPALGRLDSVLPSRKISPSRMAATMALCYESWPGWHGSRADENHLNFVTELLMGGGSVERGQSVLLARGIVDSIHG